MGGNAAFLIKDFESCPKCNSEMTLILELYKNEFPEFYFPDLADYAQINTCYNFKDPHSENDDIEYFLSYGSTKKLKKNLKKSSVQISPVYLKPIKAKEVPIAALEEKDLHELKNKLGEDTYEELITPLTGRIGTKINGDGFKWHDFDDPVCPCGGLKKHILQISTYEPEKHPNETRPYWEWESSNSVIIGRLGNYHFYVCLKCGLRELEARWDCI